MIFCRFVHPEHPSLYALSELFASELTSCIEAKHGNIVSMLQKNLEIEGLKNEEARFAGTPFSCISITRDHSCLPHDDATDYGFSFIVWLYPGRFFALEIYVFIIHLFLLIS